MESPLEILSRAAGMVTSSKRKFEEGEEQEEDQPLDFSCKKRGRSQETPPPERTSPISDLLPIKILPRPSVINHTHSKSHNKKRRRNSSDSSEGEESKGEERKFVKRRVVGRGGSGLGGGGKKKRVQVDKSRRVVVISGEDGVEEHFRRSLAKYEKNNEKTMKDNEKKEDTEVGETGTVDDHFAKALGSETWKLIKKE